MKKLISILLTITFLLCTAPLTGNVVAALSDNDPGMLVCRAKAAETTTSGYCGAYDDGSNLTWTLDKNGVLTISGKGRMKEHEQNDYPWSDINELKTVIIEDGAYNIGNDAFKGCGNLESIIIPESVFEIGRVIETAFCGVGGAALGWNDLSEDTIPPQTVIYGYLDSTAQGWANNHGRFFVEIGDRSETLPLTVSQSVTARCGGEVNIDITVENAAEKTVSLVCNSSCLSLFKTVLKLDKDGKAKMFVRGVTPGTATITVKLDGTKQKTTICLPVALPDLGDVDGDNAITPADARLALRAAVGLDQVEKNTDVFNATDADRNGKIEAEDARLILRVSIGLESF